ncbi:MAG: hypothetical protein M5U22_07550 [Thermoleophilia bacterium]|nr:hypothetical protein [Thermoleophilia bacterium]
MTKLLFVCTVNRHRSVIAEYVFKRMLAELAEAIEIDVSSAGIVTNEQHDELRVQGLTIPTPLFGYRPMPCVILHMQKRGIDVSEHRSRALTAEMVTETGLIIAMGESHRRRILGAFPETRGKVFSLAELSHAFEFEDIAAGEPPGLMPPGEYCMVECDHWAITSSMLEEVEARLTEAAPAVLEKVGYESRERQ